jgi:hypothetical protein
VAVRQVEEIYPGWESRVYLGADVPPSVEAALREAGADTRRMPVGQAYSGEFWRFLAAADPSVDAMLSRDADSKFTAREAAAVREWLESGLPFHIMRDHPGHHPPIMAGMWGCRAGVLGDIEEWVANWKDQGRYGGDQRFLSRVIYPRVRDRALIHSEIVRFPGERPRPFPLRREGLDFVGKAFRGDEIVQSQERSLAKWIAAGEPAVELPLPWSLAGRWRHLRNVARGRWDRWCNARSKREKLWG